MRLSLIISTLILWQLSYRPVEAYVFTYPVDIKDAHIQIHNSSRSRLDPESIKVLVWNIHKGADLGFRMDFLTYGLDRDLFLIQEMFQTPNVLAALNDLSLVRFDVGIAFRYRFKKGHPYSGTMIGSTVKPSFIGLSKSRDLEPVVRTHKVLTIGKYPISGHPDLLVINIHGMNVTSNKAFYRQINDGLKAMAGHKGPVIFAGDFNTNRQERIDFLERNLVHRLGFKNMKFRNDERMRSPVTNLIIDHSFIRGLDVVDAEVLGHLTSSDHKAMYFEVRVPILTLN